MRAYILAFNAYAVGVIVSVIFQRHRADLAKYVMIFLVFRIIKLFSHMQALIAANHTLTV